MSSKLTKFNQPFCWANVFDWGEIEIPIFVDNCQLSVLGCTTLAKSNLHDFKLEVEKHIQIRTITSGETWYINVSTAQSPKYKMVLYQRACLIHPPLNRDLNWNSTKKIPCFELNLKSNGRSPWVSDEWHVSLLINTYFPILINPLKDININKLTECCIGCPLPTGFPDWASNKWITETEWI